MPLSYHHQQHCGVRSIVATACNLILPRWMPMILVNRLRNVRGRMESGIMIVSHRFGFIFVKTRKTAGTSIEVFLSRHCGPDDIVTPIIPHLEPHQPRNHDGFFNHTPAHVIRNRISTPTWNRSFKFCVERNPWDKTLSYYHMMNVRQGGNLSFDDYLASGDFCIDHPAYTEPGRPEQMIVDRIIRYEELESGLTDVFTKLSIPFSGSLGINAKSEYRLDRRPYRDVYTPAQAHLVEKAFSREIAMFGYSF